MPGPNEPNDPDVDLPPPRLVIEIHRPSNGSVHSDPDRVTVQVSGRCVIENDLAGQLVVDERVELSRSVLRNGTVTQLDTHSALSNATQWWKFDIDAATAGKHTVTVTAGMHNPNLTEFHASAKRITTFTVEILPSPTIEITSPTAGATVEPGPLTVRGTCLGTDVMVEVMVGADRFDAAVSGTSWTADNVQCRSLGLLTIVAAIEDKFGRRAEVSRVITVKDQTPPHLSIEQPPSQSRVLAGALTASGSCRDDGSGVQAVEWSLDGTTFRPAILSTDRARWSLREAVTTTGPATLHIRARDASGNSVVEQRSIILVEEVAPADRSDVTSRQSYLGDLLEYICSTSPASARLTFNQQPVSPAVLESLLFQPFAGILGQAPSRALAPTPELRLVVTSLRRVADRPGGPASHALKRHLMGVYRSLLAAIGTSLEEVTRAVAGSAADRAALSIRLGIPPVIPTDGDTITRLCLDGSTPQRQLTEDNLNALFGYVAAVSATADGGGEANPA